MSRNISYIISICSSTRAGHMYPTHTYCAYILCQSTNTLTCIMYKPSTHYFKISNLIWNMLLLASYTLNNITNMLHSCLFVYSPVKPHQVGQSDVNFTMPEANISRKSNHRTNHIIKPSCDPDAPERNGANRIVRNPASNNKMSLQHCNINITTETYSCNINKN